MWKTLPSAIYNFIILQTENKCNRVHRLHRYMNLFPPKSSHVNYKFKTKKIIINKQDCMWWASHTLIRVSKRFIHCHKEIQSIFLVRRFHNYNLLAIFLFCIFHLSLRVPIQTFHGCDSIKIAFVCCFCRYVWKRIN